MIDFARLSPTELADAHWPAHWLADCPAALPSGRWRPSWPMAGITARFRRRPPGRGAVGLEPGAARLVDSGDPAADTMKAHAGQVSCRAA